MIVNASHQYLFRFEVENCQEDVNRKKAKIQEEYAILEESKRKTENEWALLKNQFENDLLIKEKEWQQRKELVERNLK